MKKSGLIGLRDLRGLRRIGSSFSIAASILLFISTLFAMTIGAAGCGSSKSRTKGIETYSTPVADMELIQHKTDMYEIRVIDARTGRGIPLIEFESEDGQHYFVTDSAGRIAISNPGLMNKEVVFNTKSHGYVAPAHKYHAGTYLMHGRVKLKIIPGGGDVFRLEPLNIAERLYRITGSKIYEASVLLGYPVPIKKPLENAQVKGQDTCGSIVYNGKIFWAYGDTMRIEDYPGRQGSFRSPMATSELPENGGLDPSIGIDLEYFTDSDGFVKDMYPPNMSDWSGKGVIWPKFVGVMGGKLVTYYARLLQDHDLQERGLAIYDDNSRVFRKIHQFDSNEPWRFPDDGGWNFPHHTDGKDWIYIGTTKRVPADLQSLKDPSKYEAWSCLADGYSMDMPIEEIRLNRDQNGKLVYRWTKNASPVNPQDELTLVNKGLMMEHEAYFLPRDVDTGKRVVMHTRNVTWNEYRKKWICIFQEIGGSRSFIGEIWYAEADEPTGPWKKAVKIVTHDKYSFYRPRYLEFFDQEGGRILYFDGCYSNYLASSPKRDEINDYNMVLYRLDLSDPRLQGAQE